MKKRNYTTGTELMDKQWAKFEPLIPEPIQSRKDGQHRASNRACLEGIIWILRTGARWCDMPERFPLREVRVGDVTITSATPHESKLIEPLLNTIRVPRVGAVDREQGSND